jgi:hypothetical protein
VVVVLTISFQVQRAAYSVWQRTEEMIDHFGNEIDDMLVAELGFILIGISG